MIKGRNITKSYGAAEVLHAVNAEVDRGQIVAVLGPNGSGKSTLLRALAMLDPPTAGRVEMDEVEYTFPPPRNGNHHPTPWPDVTMVFQQLFLWPHLTIRQNISLPLECNRVANAAQRVEEAIERFDLGEFAARHPNEVSLGQRQRAAIARAFALKPKYLLLDEITSALDIEQVGLVMDHLREEREAGTGIMLITHFVGFARHAADRILFMWDGRVIESGGPEMLDSPQTEECSRFLSLLRAEG